MTNPLFKVTLILLSLMSAVFVGQTMLSAGQKSPVTTQGLQIEVISQNTALESSSTQTTADAATTSDGLPAVPRQAATQGQQNRRSFSFHYLDILEWMFAGRTDKSKRPQSQRPSANLSA